MAEPDWTFIIETLKKIHAGQTDMRHALMDMRNDMRSAGGPVPALGGSMAQVCGFCVAGNTHKPELLESAQIQLVPEALRRYRVQLAGLTLWIRE